MVPLSDGMITAGIGIGAAGLIGGLQSLAFTVSGLDERLTEPQLALVKLPLPTLALTWGFTTSEMYTTGGALMAVLITIAIMVWFDYRDLVKNSGISLED